MTAHTKFDNQPKSDAWGIPMQGKSYLYPFNLTTPRNCGNQLIPFDYCICQFNRYYEGFYVRNALRLI